MIEHDDDDIGEWQHPPINGRESRIYPSRYEADKHFCINLMEAEPHLMAKAKAEPRLTWPIIYRICGL